MPHPDKYFDTRGTCRERSGAAGQNTSDSPGSHPGGRRLVDRKVIRVWVLLAVVTVACLALDLLTKHWADISIARGHQVRLLGNVLSLVLVHNKGALFGMNPRRFLPGFPVNVFFAVFTVIAVGVILGYYHRVALRDRLVRWGLILVLPGALGNLFDRMVRPTQGVVDFIMIDLNVWPADPWPVFNFADMYVTFGVALMLASLVRDEWRRHRSRVAPSLAAEAHSGEPARPDQAAPPTS
jgi:signal peptidase II